MDSSEMDKSMGMELRNSVMGQYTVECSKIQKLMVKGYIKTMKILYTMVNLKTICVMDMELKNFQMEMFIKGNFQNSVKHGKGNFNQVDGSSYAGDFFQGDICGKGKYLWADGREYYGFWQKNTMHGHVSLIFLIY